MLLSFCSIWSLYLVISGQAISVVVGEKTSALTAVNAEYLYSEKLI